MERVEKNPNILPFASNFIQEEATPETISLSVTESHTRKRTVYYQSGLKR